MKSQHDAFNSGINKFFSLLLVQNRYVCRRSHFSVIRAIRGAHYSGICSVQNYSCKFMLHQRKVSKRKVTQLDPNQAPFSCAFQKIAGVPMLGELRWNSSREIYGKILKGKM